MGTFTCSTISISSVDVAKIIQSGRVSLISIEEDVDGSLALKLHVRERYASLACSTRLSHPE
jgi:hypothetical protein